MGMWSNCPKKTRVDCSRMVVELVVEVIKSCVGLEGVCKGTTVS